MSNYEKTEKLNDVMKNICERIVSYYSIEDDGSSVEDAYYLIDPNTKPVLVVTTCRLVNGDNYREKAIFYVDADDVSKFFLMDMNCKVCQILNMTFDSFFVLYDIFQWFTDEYYRYKWHLDNQCNKENEELEEQEQKKAICGEWFRKGYEAGVRDSADESFMTTKEEDIKDNKKITNETKYLFIDIEKQEKSQFIPRDLPIMILEAEIFPNLCVIYYKKYYGKDHETETEDKSNVNQKTSKNEDKEAGVKEESKEEDIKESISRKMSDIGELISNGFGESVKKFMKDKEKSEEEDIEKEVCKEMKNYKPIWDSYTNGIFSVNVERLKEITKRINDTLGGILGNEESEVKEEKECDNDDNEDECSENDEYEEDEDEDEELDADADEDNLCDICRERMEKSKESKDDTENRFKWFLISAKIDIFGGIVDPVFVDEWPIEYVTTKPLTHVESNNSIVEVSFVVPCDTSKDSEEDLENIYKNKLEEVVDHIYSDDCNDLTDDKELKDVFEFAINALIIERCNEFIK